MDEEEPRADATPIRSAIEQRKYEPPVCEIVSHSSSPVETVIQTDNEDTVEVLAVNNFIPQRIPFKVFLCAEELFGDTQNLDEGECLTPLDNTQAEAIISHSINSPFEPIASPQEVSYVPIKEIKQTPEKRRKKYVMPSRSKITGVKRTTPLSEMMPEELETPLKPILQSPRHVSSMVKSGYSVENTNPQVVAQPKLITKPKVTFMLDDDFSRATEESAEECEGELDSSGYQIPIHCPHDETVYHSLKIKQDRLLDNSTTFSDFESLNSVSMSLRELAHDEPLGDYDRASQVIDQYHERYISKSERL